MGIALKFSHKFVGKVLYYGLSFIQIRRIEAILIAWKTHPKLRLEQESRLRTSQKAHLKTEQDLINLD